MLGGWSLWSYCAFKTERAQWNNIHKIHCMHFSILHFCYYCCCWFTKEIKATTTNSCRRVDSNLSVAVLQFRSFVLSWFEINSRVICLSFGSLPNHKIRLHMSFHPICKLTHAHRNTHNVILYWANYAQHSHHIYVYQFRCKCRSWKCVFAVRSVLEYMFSLHSAE